MFRLALSGIRTVVMVFVLMWSLLFFVAMIGILAYRLIDSLQREPA